MRRKTRGVAAETAEDANTPRRSSRRGRRSPSTESERNAESVEAQPESVREEVEPESDMQEEEDTQKKRGRRRTRTSSAEQPTVVTPVKRGRGRKTVAVEPETEPIAEETAQSNETEVEIEETTITQPVQEFERDSSPAVNYEAQVEEPEPLQTDAVEDGRAGEPEQNVPAEIEQEYEQSRDVEHQEESRSAVDDEDSRDQRAESEAAEESRDVSRDESRVDQDDESKNQISFQRDDSNSRDVDDQNARSPIQYERSLKPPHNDQPEEQQEEPTVEPENKDVEGKEKTKVNNESSETAKPAKRLPSDAEEGEVLDSDSDTKDEPPPVKPRRRMFINKDRLRPQQQQNTVSNSERPSIKLVRSEHISNTTTKPDVPKSPTTTGDQPASGGGNDDDAKEHNSNATNQESTTSELDTSRNVRENGHDGPPPVKQRKRKWVTQRSTESKIIAISTDSLKDIIKEPVPLSDVNLEFSPDRKERKISETKLSDIEVISKSKAPAKEKNETKTSKKDDKDKESSRKRKTTEATTTDNKKDESSNKTTKEKDNIKVPRPKQMSPSKQKPSQILYITNLVRPFTVLQLKGLLARTGKIVENGFWIDKIKSKCFIKYETEE